MTNFLKLVILMASLRITKVPIDFDPKYNVLSEGQASIFLIERNIILTHNLILRKIHKIIMI